MLTKQASKEVSKLGFGLKDANDKSLNLGIVGSHTTAEHFANTYKVNVYVDGATTPSDGYATFNNETGKLTAWFNTDSRTVATVADGLLNVTNTSSADTYLGTNTGYMTTAKVVSLMKFKVISTNDSVGTGMGSMWYSQFNTALPNASGEANKVKPNGDGVQFADVLKGSNGFVKETDTGLPRRTGCK